MAGRIGRPLDDDGSPPHTPLTRAAAHFSLGVLLRAALLFLSLTCLGPASGARAVVLTALDGGVTDNEGRDALFPPPAFNSSLLLDSRVTRWVVNMSDEVQAVRTVRLRVNLTADFFNDGLERSLSVYAGPSEAGDRIAILCNANTQLRYAFFNDTASLAALTSFTFFTDVFSLIDIETVPSGFMGNISAAFALHHFSLNYTSSHDCPTGYEISADGSGCTLTPPSTGIAFGVLVGTEVLNISGLVLALTLLLALLRHQASPRIRRMSLAGTLNMVAGIMLLCFGGLAMAIEPTSDDSAVCHIRVWLASLGTCLVLAALVAKAARLPRAFAEEHLSQPPPAAVSSRVIPSILMAAGVAQLALLIAFSIFDLTHTRERTVYGMSIYDMDAIDAGEALLGTRFSECAFNPTVRVWLGVECALLALLSLGAAYFTFRSRHLPSRGESSLICSSLAALFAASLGVLCGFGVPSEASGGVVGPNASSLLGGFGLALIGITLCFLLFRRLGPDSLRLACTRRLDIVAPNTKDGDSVLVLDATTGEVALVASASLAVLEKSKSKRAAHIRAVSNSLDGVASTNKVSSSHLRSGDGGEMILSNSGFNSPGSGSTPASPIFGGNQPPRVAVIHGGLEAIVAASTAISAAAAAAAAAPTRRGTAQPTRNPSGPRGPKVVIGTSTGIGNAARLTERDILNSALMRRRMAMEEDELAAAPPPAEYSPRASHSRAAPPGRRRRRSHDHSLLTEWSLGESVRPSQTVGAATAFLPEGASLAHGPRSLLRDDAELPDLEESRAVLRDHLSARAERRRHSLSDVGEPITSPNDHGRTPRPPSAGQLETPLVPAARTLTTLSDVAPSSPSRSNSPRRATDVDMAPLLHTALDILQHRDDHASDDVGIRSIQVAPAPDESASSPPLRG